MAIDIQTICDLRQCILRLRPVFDLCLASSGGGRERAVHNVLLICCFFATWIFAGVRICAIDRLYMTIKSRLFFFFFFFSEMRSAISGLRNGIVFINEIHDFLYYYYYYYYIIISFDLAWLSF